jgi:hypothetical protein
MSSGGDCDQHDEKEKLRIGGRTGGIGAAKSENDLAIGT